MKIKKNELSTHFFYYKDENNYFSVSVYSPIYNIDKSCSIYLTIVDGGLEFESSVSCSDELAAFSYTISLFNKFFGG